MTKRKTYIPLKKILYWWRKKNILKAFRSEIFPKAFKINERKISCVLWTKRTRVIESEIRYRSTITSIKNTINVYQIKEKKPIMKSSANASKIIDGHCAIKFSQYIWNLTESNPSTNLVNRSIKRSRRKVYHNKVKATLTL